MSFAFESEALTHATRKIEITFELQVITIASQSDFHSLENQVTQLALLIGKRDLGVLDAQEPRRKVVHRETMRTVLESSLPFQLDAPIRSAHYADFGLQQRDAG